MGVYFIRNRDTGKWLDTTRGAYEVDDFEKAGCRYWSEKAAKKTIRDLVRSHTERNENYESGKWQKYDGWKPESINYEVVVFRLELVGVV